MDLLKSKKYQDTKKRRSTLKAQEQAQQMVAKVQSQMDEGTPGSGRAVAEDDGDESSSGSEGGGNDAASMPVTRKTVTEQNNTAAAAGGGNDPATADAEQPSAQ